MQEPQPRRTKRSLKGRTRRFQVHVRRRVPPGLRLVLGLLLIGGGILGFLPILGFWMIPLGFAVAMLDLVPLYRAGLRRAGLDTPTDTDALHPTDIDPLRPSDTDPPPLTDSDPDPR